MKNQISISYTSGDDWSRLAKETTEIILAAVLASENAYTPYSGYKVGAALLLDTGVIVSGSNQENAVYPLCNCAEQVTLQKAFSENPDLVPVLFTVYTNSQNKSIPAAPCGACRQVLCESASRVQKKFPVLIADSSGKFIRFESAFDLLPFHFDASFLPGSLIR